jgi:enoyl-CoA hydratase
VIDADEALRIGLVNHVVDDADVLTRALALADEIAGNGRLAVRLAKAATNALARPAQAQAMAFESIAQAVLFDSDDKHARMTAFLERGSGTAKGREKS